MISEMSVSMRRAVFRQPEREHFSGNCKVAPYNSTYHGDSMPLGMNGNSYGYRPSHFYGDRSQASTSTGSSHDQALAALTPSASANFTASPQPAAVTFAPPAYIAALPSAPPPYSEIPQTSSNSFTRAAFKVTDGTYRKLDKLAQKAAKGSHSQQEMDRLADKAARSLRGDFDRGVEPNWMIKPKNELLGDVLANNPDQFSPRMHYGLEELHQRINKRVENQ
jgi:hypothetical protein